MIPLSLFEPRPPRPCAISRCFVCAHRLCRTCRGGEVGRGRRQNLDEKLASTSPPRTTQMHINTHTRDYRSAVESSRVLTGNRGKRQCSEKNYQHKYRSPAAQRRSSYPDRLQKKEMLNTVKEKNERWYNGGETGRGLAHPCVLAPPHVRCGSVLAHGDCRSGTKRTMSGARTKTSGGLTLLTRDTKVPLTILLYDALKE